MWRMLFIGFSIVFVYFGYGIASQGGPQAFFAGAGVGIIVTYLFLRYKQEKQDMIQKQKQQVSVNVSQNMANDSFSEEQLITIAQIVANMQQQLLVTSEHEQLPVVPQPKRLTQGERIAAILRSQNHARATE